MPAKKARSTGVGESRAFVAEPGTFPAELDWSTLTVNGEPVPENVRHLIPYAQTDQGRADADAGRVEGHVRVLSDETDSARRKYRDELEAGHPIESAEALMEVHDPLKPIMDANLPPGHRGLFMSERKCDREGMRRGVLDYQPVMKDGQRVKHGSLFLASVPERLATAADKHYKAKAESAMVHAQDKIREQEDAFMSESTRRKMHRRTQGEFDGGIKAEDPEMIVGEIEHVFGDAS